MLQEARQVRPLGGNGGGWTSLSKHKTVIIDFRRGIYSFWYTRYLHVDSVVTMIMEGHFFLAVQREREGHLLQSHPTHHPWE